LCKTSQSPVFNRERERKGALMFFANLKPTEQHCRSAARAGSPRGKEPQRLPQDWQGKSLTSQGLVFAL